MEVSRAHQQQHLSQYEMVKFMRAFFMLLQSKRCIFIDYFSLHSSLPYGVFLPDISIIVWKTFCRGEIVQCRYFFTTFARLLPFCVCVTTWAWTSSMDRENSSKRLIVNSNKQKTIDRLYKRDRERQKSICCEKMERCQKKSINSIRRMILNKLWVNRP